MSPTLGEYRVGIDFNPSGDETVNKIKRAAADLIDLVETISVPVLYETDPSPTHAQQARVVPDGEVMRLKALAMTDIETAAMHAVKAATKKPREAAR
jgi:hypothetical protein